MFDFVYQRVFMLHMGARRDQVTGTVSTDASTAFATRVRDTLISMLSVMLLRRMGERADQCSAKIRRKRRGQEDRTVWRKVRTFTAVTELLHGPGCVERACVTRC